MSFALALSRAAGRVQARLDAGMAGLADVPVVQAMLPFRMPRIVGR